MLRIWWSSCDSPLDFRRIVRLFTPNAPLPCTNTMNTTRPGRPSAARPDKFYNLSSRLDQSRGRAIVYGPPPPARGRMGAGKLLMVGEHPTLPHDRIMRLWQNVDRSGRRPRFPRPSDSRSAQRCDVEQCEIEAGD